MPQQKKINLVRLIEANPEHSDRRIAGLSKFSMKTVSRYRRRLASLALSGGPLIHSDEHSIAVVVDRRVGIRTLRDGPDFDALFLPIYLPGTPLRALWERYRDDTDDALSYSQFTRRLADHLRARREGGLSDKSATESAEVVCRKPRVGDSQPCNGSRP